MIGTTAPLNFIARKSEKKFGFREATELDQEAAVNHLASEIIPFELNEERLLAELKKYFREWKLEPPTSDRMKRIIRSAKNRFEEAFADQIFAQLPQTSREKLLALLENQDSPVDSSTENNDLEIQLENQTEVSPVTDIKAADETRITETKQTVNRLPTLIWLRGDPGKLNLECVLDELEKLPVLREIALPFDSFSAVSSKTVAAFRQRLMAESSYETARHFAPLRLTLLAAFCYQREQEVNDNLVELLLNLVHKINASAEKKVVKQIVGEIKKVAGKPSILVRLAQTAIEHPDGVIRETLFPVVGEQTLKDVIRSIKPRARVTANRFIR